MYLNERHRVGLQSQTQKKALDATGNVGLTNALDNTLGP
ncbi:hypothetical protein SNOG_12349 [Parastagonospora nodorum SN15]|uniref:Uncharacterized protein n=1 Tax=Phaeosphaeria nodorum (strain SN15 / ATCC MYA-4574 / FGSC 10173) TaxID=321614 RepID=Q0U7B5_PHANO|nr:hypothetical protein SNOG_12349 [Parastagonospora nodorum SN15]EAT80162.1 hypothetical protein SNOG_12349 [Parastagonospora nodorum SN15]